MKHLWWVALVLMGPACETKESPDDSGTSLSADEGGDGDDADGSVEPDGGSDDGGSDDDGSPDADGSGDADDTGETDGDGDADADGSDPIECAELEPDVCNAYEHCRVLSGSPVDVDAECVGTLDPEEVGCMESEIDCGMAMTWASGPDGTCMEFTSTCTPDGWSICNPLDSCETGDDDGSDDAGDGTSDDGPEPLVCSELDPETCGGEPLCTVLSGSPVDVDAECMGTLASEPAGCLDAGMMCSMTMTWASGPDGTCMEFPTTCIPDGWSGCDPMEACETGDDGTGDDDGTADDDGTSDDDGSGSDDGEPFCPGTEICGPRIIGSATDMDSMSICSMVDGNIMVAVFGSPLITDADGMGCLTEVTGDINISGVDTLTNIDGMSNLRAVGGDLLIWGNDGLTTIAGLTGLESVGGDIEIRVNEALCQSTVDALIAGIPHIGGTVETDGNAPC